MNIHSFNETIHPLTPWRPEDFAPTVTFSGAHKLAASGVAPLVAAVRGYETVEFAQVADAGKRHNLGRANGAQQSQLRRLAERGDVLILPWYQGDQVAKARKLGRLPIASSLQFRPSHPMEDSSTGKIRKYENLVRADSVIDTHPATPSGWFNEAPRVLVTEGVLKGDAALTGLLRANGIADTDLECPRAFSRPQALDRLSELMGMVREEERVAILCLVGVGNWRGNNLWTSLPLAGRELLVAFDGDTATNANVWSQANQLWEYAKSREAVVKFVDLAIPNPLVGESGPEPVAASEKVGLDDYLARHGSWQDLLTLRRDDLPLKPASPEPEVEVGAYRVAPDGYSVQQYVAERNSPDGGPAQNHWQHRVGIGGRVRSMITFRTPTDQEIETGKFGEGVESDGTALVGSRCEVKLQWRHDDGTTDQAIVRGPASMLMNPPQRWDELEANIPNNLLLHPEWPPRAGQNWLAAIKANNAIPSKCNTSWMTMGWVPVEGSSVCAFISGRTVLEPTDATERTIAGVTNVVLPGASGFSLPDNPPVMTEEWKQQVRQDLLKLREHFIERPGWRDPGVAAIVLAAGLRPVAPLHCTTAIYLQGPPGQGKSVTAAAVLAFHQACKTWTNKNLPGSMQDTGTSIEQAIAQTNIWVMDDLAPSPDPYKYNSQQARVGDIIRAVHNRSSKRRSGVELKAREVFDPKALLIVTAENEHTIGSVRDRTLIITVHNRYLMSSRISDMQEWFDTAAPARVTRACAELLQHIANEHGWKSVIETMKNKAIQYREVAERTIADMCSADRVNARQVDMAMDLMMGLAPLQLLAEAVGDNTLSNRLDESHDGNLPLLIARHTGATVEAQGHASMGQTMVASLRNLFLAGYAHVENGDDVGKPPTDNKHTNRLLGWQEDGDGKPRPRGVTIGRLRGVTKKSEQDVVMFDRINAFQEAQRRYPVRIPSGTSANTAFSGVWDDELIHPYYAKKGRDGNRVDVVYFDGGSKRGVPVHLDDIRAEK